MQNTIDSLISKEEKYNETQNNNLLQNCKRTLDHFNNDLDECTREVLLIILSPESNVYFSFANRYSFLNDEHFLI